MKKAFCISSLLLTSWLFFSCGENQKSQQSTERKYKTIKDRKTIFCNDILARDTALSSAIALYYQTKIATAKNAIGRPVKYFLVLYKVDEQYWILTNENDSRNFIITPFTCFIKTPQYLLAYYDRNIGFWDSQYYTREIAKVLDSVEQVPNTIKYKIYKSKKQEDSIIKWNINRRAFSSFHPTTWKLIKTKGKILIDTSKIWGFDPRNYLEGMRKEDLLIDLMEDY